jgi:hypothetical protein
MLAECAKRTLQVLEIFADLTLHALEAVVIVLHRGKHLLGTPCHSQRRVDRPSWLKRRNLQFRQCRREQARSGKGLESRYGIRAGSRALT